MFALPTLQPFAAHPADSRGRRVAEPESPTRTVYQRDRDRVIHSAAFRRLKHKTQVFVAHEGDAYRTRLTHSLEVSQVARSLCRNLGLSEDLGEALALAHDLGHPPFGHAGEEALNHAMEGLGGFDHNDQTFRILTMLERRYVAFDGLNLTWETLEGIAKHNGPLAGPRRVRNRPVPPTIASVDAQYSLDLATFASAEAQAAAIADDIAYNNHDIDDGLRAGLFTMDDLADVPLVGRIFGETRAAFPTAETPRLIHESIRRVMNFMIEDVLTESRARLAALNPQSVDDIRCADRPVVGFSDEMSAFDADLRAFLFERMYRHYRVNRMTTKARRIIGDLFRVFMEEPCCMPTEWHIDPDLADKTVVARRVADYIAGMTDRYAVEEHNRLFDVFTRP